MAIVRGSKPPKISDYQERLGRSDCSANNVIHDVSAHPLVSVITVCRNSEQTIRRTVASVLSQTYRNIEFLIIDGNSSDATVSIIEEYRGSFACLISEPDRGISDAFNKGLARASGSIVMLLNSDDWIGPGFIEAAIDGLSESRADFVFGDLIFYSPEGQKVGGYKGDPNYKKKLSHVMPAINHPTVVCQKYVYDNCGLFNVNLHYAMDYEWLIRVDACGYQGHYVTSLVTNMTLDGRSDAGFAKSLLEVREISIAYGYSALLAYGRYGARLAKGHLRRLLEVILPKFVTNSIRVIVNKNYVREI